MLWTRLLSRLTEISKYPISIAKYATMTTRVDPVVSPDWLKSQMDSDNSNVIVLDCTFQAEDPTVRYERYTKSHIPGALYFDLDHGIKPRPTCARNLPDAKMFEENAQSLGISSQSHLVVYDRDEMSGAGKTWWLFRLFGHQSVSLLDGGLMNWQNSGYDVASGEEKSTKIGDFTSQLVPSLMTSYDQILQIVRDKSAQIIDTRMEQNYLGDEPEPSLVVRMGLQSMNQPIPSSIHAGHMAGAKNIFMIEVFKDEMLRFRSKEELENMFTKAGIDLTKPIVTTCYMGHSASLLNLAAFICGYENTSLYYGSWTEFGQLAPYELVETKDKSKL